MQLAVALFALEKGLQIKVVVLRLDKLALRNGLHGGGGFKAQGIAHRYHFTGNIGKALHTVGVPGKGFKG